MPVEPVPAEPVPLEPIRESAAWCRFASEGCLLLQQSLSRLVDRLYISPSGKWNSNCDAKQGVASSRGQSICRRSFCIDKKQCDGRLNGKT